METVHTCGNGDRDERLTRFGPSVNDVAQPGVDRSRKLKTPTFQVAAQLACITALWQVNEELSEVTALIVEATTHVGHVFLNRHQ